MPREVFRARLDGDVHAVLQGAEVERGRPGVVHRDEGAARVGGPCDRGHVLHLEGERAGRLGVDEPRVPAHQRRDVRPRRGVVEARLDAVAAQDHGAEAPGGSVHRVGDEYVITGADHRGDRHRHRGEPAAGHHGAMPALDRRDRLGQRPRVLGAGRAVGDVVVAVVAVEAADVAFEVLGEDRRCPVHRDVDRPLRAHRRPAERDELRVLLHSPPSGRCAGRVRRRAGRFRPPGRSAPPREATRSRAGRSCPKPTRRQFPPAGGTSAIPRPDRRNIAIIPRRDLPRARRDFGAAGPAGALPNR